jgi:hypothetical protein
MAIANTTIQIKKSGSTGNKPASLNFGELALNYFDGKLFYKDSSGNISYFYGANNGPSFATANANNNLILASTPNDTISFNAANGISITACTTTKTITIGDPTTFSLASSAAIYANGAFTQANAAFDAANTGSTPAYAFAQANAAFIQANAAFNAANTGSSPAFAFTQANAAFGVANSASLYANGAFSQANSAYTRANNSVSANAGGTITGDINITGNLIVTGANVALGNVGNVHIYGGNTGQLLSTDNFGNLSFIDLPTPNTVSYTANSLIQTNGVYVSGNLWSTQVFGDYASSNGSYVLTDGSGSAPAWYITFDFINVVKFNRVVMNINYTQSSGHTIYVQLYNYLTSTWDSIGTYTGLGSYYAFALEVIDETNYVNAGIVQLKLYHSNSGNITHQTNIDYIALEQSYQGPQGPRGPTGATGSAGQGIATGGSAGQVLVKNSSTNYDTSWSSDLINSWNTANAALPLTGGTITGSIVINQDATIQGNLYVYGNSTSINTSSFSVQDSLFILGVGNYTTDILDIGFAAHYNNGTNAHTGLIRDSGSKDWLLFEGYTPEVTPNNNIIITDSSFKYANLTANTVRANVIANTIYVSGYNVFTYITNAFTKANSAFDTANASSGTYATAGFTQANSAYAQANSAALYANGSFIQANAAYGSQNTTGTYANTAYAQANSAALYANGSFIQANAAYGVSNSASLYANAAFIQANAAFAAANTNTPRVVTIADGTSVTINGDTTDIAVQTNTQAAGTLTINAVTGTLYNGQKIIFRLKSTNVQTFSWNAVFAGSTDLSLPTSSTGSSKYDYVGFIYNTDASKWQIVAKNFGF